MTWVLTVRDGPTDATAAEIQDLLHRVEQAHGGALLDEQKRRQVTAGGAWTAVLAHDDDRLAGYAHIRWHDPEARPRASVELVVDPGFEPAGDLRERLVDAASDTVAAAGGGGMHMWVRRVADPADTAPARRGLAVQRRLAQMRAPLARVPQPPPPPPGVVIRPYRPEQDDAALIAVNNAAFAHHPEQGGWTDEHLASRRELDWFDPRDVLLAWRDDDLLGFHWTKRHPGCPPIGEVYVLAVAPSGQGLGLGRVLLTTGLAHLYERGARAALLYVDLADTGPVRLYESAGFAVAQLDVCYERTVDPIRGPREPRAQALPPSWPRRPWGSSL